MEPGFPPDLSSDDPNPYAPPKTHGTIERRGSIGEVPFDLGCILGATLSLYKERLGACLVVCWTAMVLQWGSQFLMHRIREALAPRGGAPFDDFLVPFTLFFAFYVFNGWVSVGQYLALLEVARRRSGAFDQLFRGWRFLLTSLLAGVLFVAAIGLAVVVILLAIPLTLAFVGWNGLATMAILVIATSVAIAISTHVAVRLYLFQYMIVDQNAGVVDSLILSWEATRGRVGTLLLIFLCASLLCLAGLLACFVGILFTAPIAYLMLTVTYLSLTEQPLGEEKPEIAFWDEDGP